MYIICYLKAKMFPPFKCPNAKHEPGVHHHILQSEEAESNNQSILQIQKFNGLSEQFICVKFYNCFLTTFKNNPNQPSLSNIQCSSLITERSSSTIVSGSHGLTAKSDHMLLLGPALIYTHGSSDEGLNKSLTDVDLTFGFAKPESAVNKGSDIQDSDQCSD